MKKKYLVSKLIMTVLSMCLLCGCEKSNTAEVTISDGYEETTDNIDENTNNTEEDSIMDETVVMDEQDIDAVNDGPTWNYTEIESKIKETLISHINDGYVGSESTFTYTIYEEQRLIIVRASVGGDYAYGLVACVFDNDWDEFDFLSLGNERSQVYVLPQEGKIVSIYSDSVDERYYEVYHFGSDEDFYFIEMDIKVKADFSAGLDNGVYSMIAIGGEYVEGEDWPDTKERLINESANFLTEDYGCVDANLQDSRYDSVAYNSYYAGSSEMVDDAFRLVIAELQRALNSDNDNDLSVLGVDIEIKWANSLGFAEFDYDGDGVKELIIGEDEGTRTFVWAVYEKYQTGDGWNTAVAVSGYARNRYYLMDGNRLLNEWSSGASDCGTDIYKLDSAGGKFLESSVYDDYSSQCIKLTLQPIN